VDYVSEVIVSKGLASLLYGPSALGGAVNVVSRKPAQLLEVSGRAEVEADDHSWRRTSSARLDWRKTAVPATPNLKNPAMYHPAKAGDYERH
jgi:outer membrane receptor protein involved in Fe transport